MKKRILSLSLLVFIFASVFSLQAFASSPDDVIHNYVITVDVNEDATLTINYHIEWEVLNSAGPGPLTWIKVGIPNSHYVKYEPLSGTIKSMKYTSSEGAHLRIDLDREYVKGDTVNIDFCLVQDYMYLVNKLTEGETVYSFTPSWFDDITVENLVIRWNTDKAVSWSQDCLMVGNYLEWQTSLSPGGRYTVTVTYPNDAYAFDLSKSEEVSSRGSGDTDSSSPFEDTVLGLIGLAIIFLMIRGFFKLVFALGRGFVNAVTPKTEKKITRTLVSYYDTCPGCGAVREEGKTVCAYCGRDLVKSEEIIEEKDIPNPGKYTKEGEYGYPSMPNTYIRVHVVNVPRPAPVRSSSSSSYSSSRSSSSSSRSSCACVSSCACACACACAGGGRAGCSNKDFYSVKLKLEQLGRICR